MPLTVLPTIPPEVVALLNAYFQPQQYFIYWKGEASLDSAPPRGSIQIPSVSDATVVVS
jgi:hypothetical protein